MKRLMMLLWVILCVAVFAVGYVRLAPVDAAVWDKPLTFDTDRDMKRGVQRVVDTGPQGLARLDAIARATPRTTVLAGSVEAGRITYVTRTAVIGFPDYTTVEQDGDQLKIYARLRFGRSDFGVNGARVAAWLNALQTG